MENGRDWGVVTRFDPERGVVVRPPPGEGRGYWAGAPGAMFDKEAGLFYLVYRLRRPRGVAPDRGAEVRIARSADGVRFDDIWSGTKDALGSQSIERCALVRGQTGQWVLYVSFVDPGDGRWRIDRVEAGGPDRFDLRSAQAVLTASQIGLEGVKDPFVFRVGGLDHMLMSVALAGGPASARELHGSSDAYNTGLIRSATALATSSDGLRWQFEGVVFEPPAHGWDRYCTRIGTIWHQPPVWLALYDGSADVSENYEERCGLAYSFDLRQFHRATPFAPWLATPSGRSVRYVDVLALPDAHYFYYEMAQPDGSHDLRVFRAERE
jgi:hypothetical protein